ncbi:DoxX family protein [Paraflavitalea sp. CAU 1676]|uniref:DoxX family protein n=1 Tax=Paraflavitalea sp. CAU 1676 TaxID=3032598 RepID=UPI0023D98EAB|nr:DoxX family protein [Paraflavitalea sp. CAU 1676]MDF2188352.1 DoxX family protein [Paraflavitalea sp. CAU 1676]
MKKTTTLYWIFTSLFATFTLLTAVTQIAKTQSSLEVMNILRVPLYLLPFLGLAKVMAVVAILVPGFPRTKEWAYAGMIFDNAGATYAMIAVGGSADKWAFMAVPILLCVFSYRYYHQLLKHKNQPVSLNQLAI